MSISHNLIGMGLTVACYIMRWTPPVVRIILSALLTVLFMLFARQKRNVFAVNWRLCEQAVLSGREHRRRFLQWRCAFLHAMSLWDFMASLVMPNAALKRIMILENKDSESWLQGKTIVYLPHFVGASMAGRYLTAFHDSAFIYSPSKVKAVAIWMHLNYSRVSHNSAFLKNEGILPLVRRLHHNRLIQLSTDLDIGRRDSIFVPFFGVATATTPIIPQLAAKMGAQVLGVVCVRQPISWFKGWWCTRYILKVERINAPWSSWTALEGQAHLHQWLEQQVCHHVDSYWWFHKRFKTRPVGEAFPYNHD